MLTSCKPPTPAFRVYYHYLRTSRWFQFWINYLYILRVHRSILDTILYKFELFWMLNTAWKLKWSRRDVTNVTRWGVALYELHQMLWCDICSTFKNCRARSYREHHKQMGTRLHQNHRHVYSDVFWAPRWPRVSCAWSITISGRLCFPFSNDRGIHTQSSPRRFFVWMSPLITLNMG